MGNFILKVIVQPLYVKSGQWLWSRWGVGGPQVDQHSEKRHQRREVRGA